MNQILHIHPVNPQQRLLKEAVDMLRNGGVVVYPTDSSYALGCRISDTDALDRIKIIRQLDKHHFFTLMCRDLSNIATYAYVDNPTYRLLNAHTPGPYTFILKATKEVPRRLQHLKRKTIGIRVPDCLITQELLKELQEPLLSSTLILPQENQLLTDPDEIFEKLHSQVDLIIDGGIGTPELTSIIDLTQNQPNIIRVGKGDVSDF